MVSRRHSGRAWSRERKKQRLRDLFPFSCALTKGVKILNKLGSRELLGSHLDQLSRCGGHSRCFKGFRPVGGWKPGRGRRERGAWGIGGDGVQGGEEIGW